jgi:regulator of sirC expression with transglutaminase-like and TPR domain
MIPKTREDAEHAIRACAKASGDAFDLTACALAFSVHENPNRDVSRAQSALEMIATEAMTAQPRSAGELAALLFGKLGFEGARHDYDDPANADLMSILQRKQGLPVGLGIVWRHAAKAVGVPLYGTDVPGHFILRLETQAEPSFIDPFEGGAQLGERELQALARAAGLEALTSNMLRPVSDRVIAVRLQTNLAARARATGDIDGWERASFRRLLLLNDHWRAALDYSEAAEASGLMKVAIEWAERARAMPGAPPIEARAESLKSKLN